MLNLLLLIFIIGIFESINKRTKGSNKLNRRDTDLIKGVSILMIVFSHITVQLG